MPQSVIHEMLYMKHPTRLKILQGVFLCSNLYVTSPEKGAENFSEITDTEAKQLGFPSNGHRLHGWLQIRLRCSYSAKSRMIAVFSSFCNHVTLKREEKVYSASGSLCAEKESFPARLQVFGYKETEVCL